MAHVHMSDMTRVELIINLERAKLANSVLCVSCEDLRSVGDGYEYHGVLSMFGDVHDITYTLAGLIQQNTELASSLISAVHHCFEKDPGILEIAKKHSKHFR